MMVDDQPDNLSRDVHEVLGIASAVTRTSEPISPNSGIKLTVNLNMYARVMYRCDRDDVELSEVHKRVSGRGNGGSVCGSLGGKIASLRGQRPRRS